VDDEIRHDFLIAAGELLERLDGELIELEAAPDDRERLNAACRASHTRAGGAGDVPAKSGSPEAAGGMQGTALLVDELIGPQDAVIKPLGALPRGTRAQADATITGDGKIALILDLPSLIDACARR